MDRWHYDLPKVYVYRKHGEMLRDENMKVKIHGSITPNVLYKSMYLS